MSNLNSNDIKNNYIVEDSYDFNFKPAKNTNNEKKPIFSSVPPRPPSQKMPNIETSQPPKIEMKKENNDDFHVLIKKYVVANNPKIYILTPCFGSVCYTNYVNCLLPTLEVFRSLNIKYQVEFCKNDSLVSRARNNLIARAMNDKEMTHIIFIDNDISWHPVSILKLMVSDKNIIGGIYPLKHYFFDRLVNDPLNPYNTNVVQGWLTQKKNTNVNNMMDDETYIQNKLLRYNVNYLDNYINIDNNLLKVKHVPTGFMMIKRFVFEKMMLAYPSTKYVDDVCFLREEENEYAYALFDCGVEEGHYLSEDWLFCSRWQKMGGDVWIDVSISLTHTGIEDYKGSYFTTLM